MRSAALWLLFFAAGSAHAADLPFKLLSTGKVNGQVESGLSEARDQQSLADIWSRLHLRGAVPKLNFNRRMAVAWVGGGSACDKFVLTRARESDAEVVLEIQHKRPPPGQMCIMIFSPSHLVASIPLTRKPVRVNLPGGAPTGAESR
jgi:hypothetical protein